MTLQILALGLVVMGFSGLLLWVYSPANKDRLDLGSRLPLDDDEYNNAAGAKDTHNE